MKILVVDDDDDVRSVVRRALVADGHVVDTAHSVASAREQIAAAPPHLVVLDIGLPRMNGYEAATAIRQLPGLADVVIIGLTGYGQAADYEQSRRADFDAHLVKPIEIDTLLDALTAGRRRLSDSEP